MNEYCNCPAFARGIKGAHHEQSCPVVKTPDRVALATLIRAHAGKGEGIPPIASEQALRLAELIEGSGAIRSIVARDNAPLVTRDEADGVLWFLDGYLGMDYLKVGGGVPHRTLSETIQDDAWRQEFLDSMVESDCAVE